MFAWLSVQVSYVQIHTDRTTLSLYSCLFYLVCSGQCCSLCQVHSEAREPVSLRHSTAAVLCYSVDAPMAVCHRQVWKKDGLFCQHVDPHVPGPLNALCRLLPLQCLSTSDHRSNGGIQCLPSPLVSSSFPKKSCLFNVKVFIGLGQCCQM